MLELENVGSPAFSKLLPSLMQYCRKSNRLSQVVEIAVVKDLHPHRGRHTVATEMVSRGIDPLLARQITRHKSEKSFERYSKRALQKQAEAQFLLAFGIDG